MNKFLVILSVIFSAMLAFAAQENANSFVRTLPELRKAAYESLDTCDQAVFSDDHYLAVSVNEGGFTGRPTASGHMGHVVRLISLLNPVESKFFETEARVFDLKIEKGILYILTSKTLEAWDLATDKRLFIFVTRPDLDYELDWRKVASGFVLNNGRAIISHSVLGLSVIDLATGKFLKLMDMPTESSAQDIALLNDNEAVVAVDNNAEATFRGIYVLNLKTLEVTKQIRIDNAFSSSIRVLPGNRLMLNFFNAIWKFDLDSAIAATSEPKPSRRTWKFPGISVTDMVGKVHFDEKNLYSCFKIWDEKTGEKSVKPLAFDLETLKLQSSH